MDKKEMVRAAIGVSFDGVESLARYYAAECVNHAANDEVGIVALAQYYRTYEEVMQPFGQLATEVRLQVAEGDHVVTHLVMRGRHVGDFGGLEGTGRTLQFNTIRIDRIEDGKIVEFWSVANTNTVVATLGAVALESVATDTI